jgi:hypothetical protein
MIVHQGCQRCHPMPLGWSTAPPNVVIVIVLVDVVLIVIPPPLCPPLHTIIVGKLKFVLAIAPSAVVLLPPSLLPIVPPSIPIIPSTSTIIFIVAGLVVAGKFFSIACPLPILNRPVIEQHHILAGDSVFVEPQ